MIVENIGMSKEAINYLSQYIDLTDDVQKAIEEHAKEYGIEPEVCAWYEDHADFVTDWADAGYTVEKANNLLKDNPQEFMELPDGLGIVRFVV